MLPNNATTNAALIGTKQDWGSDSSEYTYSFSDEITPRPSASEKFKEQQNQRSAQMQPPPNVTTAAAVATPSHGKIGEPSPKEGKTILLDDRPGNLPKGAKETERKDEKATQQAAKSQKTAASSKEKRSNENVMTSLLSNRSGDAQRIAIYFLFFLSLLHLLFVILSTTLSQLDQSMGGCYTFWGYKADCDTVRYTLRTSLFECAKLKSSLQVGAAFSIPAILLSAAVTVIAWRMACSVRQAMRVRQRQGQYQVMTQEEQPVDQEMAPQRNSSAIVARDPRQNKQHTKRQESSPPLIEGGPIKWLAVILMVTSIACELIAWSMVALIYTTRPCEDTSLPRTTVYGAGFGIGVTAFLIHIILLGVLLLFV